MSSTPDFPFIPPALVEHLDQIIPESSPVLGESLADLMFRGGQRDVIRLLKLRLRYQEEGEPPVTDEPQIS